MTSSGRPGTSASTSLPARNGRAASPLPEKTDATRAGRPPRYRPYAIALADVAGGAWRGRASSSVPRRSERRSGLPDRRPRASRFASACWPSLFAVVSVLAFNFFFLPPVHTFTIADPNQCRGLVLLPARCAHRQQPDGAGARQAIIARASVPRPRRISILFSRKLAGVGIAGRSAVGDGVPDRLDAQGPGRHPDAGARSTRGEVRLSAGGHARRGRSRGAANGPWRMTGRPDAAPTRFRVPSGCSCPCGRAAVRWA